MACGVTAYFDFTKIKLSAPTSAAASIKVTGIKVADYLRRCHIADAAFLRVNNNGSISQAPAVINGTTVTGVPVGTVVNSLSVSGTDVNLKAELT